MCNNCCGQFKIVQLGAAAPFTFSVTGGNSPYNGGLGVITGPIVVNSGDILHLFSANTINFNVTPGSVNIGAEVRLDPNPLNTITASVAGLLSLGGGTINNPVFVTPQTWDFGGNNWAINNIDNWTVGADDISFTSNTFDVSAAQACFSGITQNDALTRFLVQDVGGCLSWRDVSTLPGAGGGMTSFTVAASFGPSQSITDTNTLSILGSTLIRTTASATDTVTLTLEPGSNGQIMYTNAGVAAWAFTQDILDTLSFTNNVTWNFNANDWTVTNVDDWAVTANTFTLNSPSVCFTGITQNDALTRFMVQDAGGCISWRDVSTLPGAGGGMTSFNATGNSGVSQNIVDSNTLSILGTGLLTSVASATDTITLNIVPGVNGQIMSTVGGVATWINQNTIVPNITNVTVTGATTWDFLNNNWTVNNIDNWVVDSNTITFNAPAICFTGITQNDTLTRFMVQDAGGCISWRDVASLPSGTPTVVNGLSLSGSTIRLGSSSVGGAPLTFNTSIDLAGFGITFRAVSVGLVGAPSGQSTALSIQNNYGGAISGNAYDFENPFPGVADFAPMGFATWASSGVMRRVDHDQMPYHNRLLSSNTILATNDSVVEVDTTAGAVTITLPVGAGFYTGAIPTDGQGKIYTVKKIAGGNTLTVVVSGGGLIDGVASKVISAINDAATFQATSATEYSIIYDYAPGGGGFTSANNGLSSSGAIVQLGTVLAGTGAPLTANRFLEIGSFTFDFTGNAGASKVLGLDDAQNAAWRSDYYDLASSTIQHAKADRPTFFTNLGILQQSDRVVRRAVTAISADYTVVPNTDEHIHVDTTGGPVTITLASLAASGGVNARRTDTTGASWYQFLTISRRGGNALTIQAAGGETIDNVASITVNNNRGVSIQGVSTTDWVTVSNR